MNIIKVDTDKLFSGINEYQAKFNITPYIICNQSTIQLIASQFTVIGSKEDILKFKETEETGMIASYKGYKVLEDESLRLGEVEIR